MTVCICSLLPAAWAAGTSCGGCRKVYCVLLPSLPLLRHPQDGPFSGPSTAREDRAALEVLRAVGQLPFEPIMPSLAPPTPPRPTETMLAPGDELTCLHAVARAAYKAHDEGGSARGPSDSGVSH